jgi:hypothetical protein
MPYFLHLHYLQRTKMFPILPIITTTKVWPSLRGASLAHIWAEPNRSRATSMPSFVRPRRPPPDPLPPSTHHRSLPRRHRLNSPNHHDGDDDASSPGGLMKGVEKGVEMHAAELEEAVSRPFTWPRRPPRDP